jgi:hypothetical protein
MILASAPQVLLLETRDCLLMRAVTSAPLNIRPFGTHAVSAQLQKLGWCAVRSGTGAVFVC